MFDEEQANRFVKVRGRCLVVHKLFHLDRRSANP